MIVTIIFATLLSINNGLIYVPHARPYDEARAFCKNVYGTDLASITTADERAEAISDIGGTQTDEAWIGLYSKRDDGVWRFVNGDECPNTNSVFRCVDFWLYKLNDNTNTRPRCISNDGSGEGGYQCAHFEAAQDGVDNDISCDENLPFFCQDGEATCDIPGTVQRGYPLADLINDGWTLCYQNNYADGNTLAQLTGLCPTGEDYYLFVGALQNVNSDNVFVGAFGPSSVLTTRTHDQYVAVKPNELVSDPDYHVWWHNSDATWINGNSFGFSADQAINLFQADTQTLNYQYRLSWHMDINFGGWVGGWSAGENRVLNANTVWQKIIYYKECTGEKTLEGLNPDVDVGRQYYVVEGATTYDDSQQSCQDTYGTDLATITTNADMADAIYIMDYNQITRAWIGLNDRNSEGIFLCMFYFFVFILATNSQTTLTCYKIKVNGNG